MGKRGERDKRQLILENKVWREFGGVDGKMVGGPRGRRVTEEEKLVVHRRGSREGNDGGRGRGTQIHNFGSIFT